MIVTLMAIIIGVVIAVPGTILPARRYLKPRHEKIFYSMLLIPIALIYIGFAYYYDNLEVMHAEVIGLGLFVIIAFVGQLISSKMIWIGYLAHAMWDIAHEIFFINLESLIPLTQTPTGYAVFCLVVDVIIACYVFQRCAVWDSEEQFIDSKGVNTTKSY